MINAIKFSIEEIEASDQYFDHTGSPGAGEVDSSYIPPAKSDPPKQRKNDNDNQIRDERRLHYPAPVMDSS